ncbi:MAG: TatD family hydrolase [Clostridium sp.]|nr:TatD family hydrolase [Clostridium sp.]
MIFDSHAHYDDEQFDKDREALLMELNENGVMGILNMSSSYESINKTINLTKKYPFIYGAIGIHPSDALDYNDDVKNEIISLLKKDKIVAIGEVGLDYYWEDNPSKEVQRKVLEDQYDIARKASVPIILHDREAHGDIMEIYRKNSDVISVFHSYSGSPEMAKEIISLGGYIGVSGVVTFKNAKKLPDVVKETPLNRILIETDAPYMSPVPNRGKRNRSDFLYSVADKIAEIKGVSSKEVLLKTQENVKRILKID